MDIYERKLMLVDDNQELLEMIADILRHSGYKNIVKAKCVQEALTVFQMEKPDMAVLDVMLPDGDGFQLFQKLRENSEIPILFLSARDEDRDRLFGLGLGADDYITKPFSIKELMARVKAVTRRYAAPSQPIMDTSLEIGELYIDMENYEVFKRNEKIDLTLKEFELLKLLALNRGKVLTRNYLLDKIWGYEYFGETRTVDVHIRHLRKKIEDNDKKPQYIETIRGVGYKIK